MGTFGVVDHRELVEQRFELGEGVGRGLLFEPTFQGLMETFDLAAGGRVVGSAVLLLDAEAVKFGFEAVAATPAARESGREHHAVIGQR